MNAQTMLELLEYIKRNRSQYFDKSVHLFKLIYDDFYSYLSKREEGLSGDDSFLTDVADFIDDDSSSILYNFKMMMLDGNGKFIYSFFEKIDFYFLMVDNHLYRDDDFVPCTMIFNIYLMLQAYVLYRNDFNKFCTALNDFSTLISPGELIAANYNGFDFELVNKKNVIDKLLYIRGYDSIPFLKNRLDDCINNICKYSIFDDVEEELNSLDFVSRIVGDVNRLRIEDKDFDTNVVTKLIEDFYDDYFYDDYHFYAPILLYKNRFNYIRDCYDTYLQSDVYMNEVMEILYGFNNRLFVYLDSISDNDKDSFEVYMNIVFDSDSLQEVINKLNILKEASDLFNTGNFLEEDILKDASVLFNTGNFLEEDIFNKIKSLSSFDVKKVLPDGKIVTYNDNYVNKIERPSDIESRMVEVYSDLYDLNIDDIRDELDNHFNCCSSIDEFEDGVYSVLEELINEQKIEDEEKQIDSTMSEYEFYGFGNEVESNIELKSFDNSGDKNNSNVSQKSIRKFFGRK